MLVRDRNADKFSQQIKSFSLLPKMCHRGMEVRGDDGWREPEPLAIVHCRVIHNVTFADHWGVSDIFRAQNGLSESDQLA